MLKGVRRLSSHAAKASSAELVVSTLGSDGVVTIRMNDPRRLNAWSPPMFHALCTAFDAAAADPAVRAAVYTGTGEYFCSGGDFVGMLKLGGAPWTLRPRIAASNEVRQSAAVVCILRA